MKGINITNDDALTALANIEDNTYHAVLTDPPYGLSNTPDMKEVLTHWLNGDDYEHKGKGFIGKTWDSFVPGPSVWKELYRVCRPGAFLFAYCGTRTVDLLSIAIRLGGWEKFDEIDVYGSIDRISWLNGSGFPKSFNLSRQFDKRAGERGNVIESKEVPDQRNGHGREYGSHLYAHSGRGSITHETLEPVTEEAKRWYDYGTLLCPAHEIVLLFRKPREGTFLDNVEKWGTGALNIGGTRIPTYGEDRENHLKEWDRKQSPAAEKSNSMNSGLKDINLNEYAKEGRWPKNAIFIDSDNGLNLSDELDEQVPHSKSKRSERGAGIDGNLFKSPEYESSVRGHNDSGSVKRFFYVAKSSSKERKAGVTKTENKHPTIKPIQLNKYLATMIMPPEYFIDDAKLLVPYSGSGSEIIGALLAGWKNIDGIDSDKEYVEVSSERISWWQAISDESGETDPSAILQYATKNSKL